MAILNKDGKEYRFFSEPNPLVLEQETLGENLDFHNFKWTSHVEKTNKLSIPKKEIKPNIEEFIKTLSMPEEKPIGKPIEELEVPAFIGKDPFPNLGMKPKEIVKPIEELPEPDVKKDNHVEVPDSSVLIVWVLPVKYIEKLDKVYNEIRKTKRFGQKYEIESIVLSMNDIEIQLLTDTKVEKNAIIYASRFKNGDLGYMRWYEVIKVTEQGENFIVEGIITDFHPDFSSL
jgi:hypothetical protein